MKRFIWNKHTKRVMKHLAGWLCIVAGIVMLITPGQGLLTLLMGVYLLADEVPLFGKIKSWVQHRFPKTANYVRLKGEQMKARFNAR